MYLNKIQCTAIILFTTLLWILQSLKKNKIKWQVFCNKYLSLICYCNIMCRPIECKWVVWGGTQQYYSGPANGQFSTPSGGHLLLTNVACLSQYSQDPWFQRNHRFEAFENRVINKVINPKIHQGNPVCHKNKYAFNFTVEEQLGSNKSYFYL